MLRSTEDTVPISGSAGGRAPGLSRRVSWFLAAFGVWSWVIWVNFVKNLWKDGSGLAFDDAGEPTGYFWVHLLLAVTSLALGTAIGVIGLRGLRALRKVRREALPAAAGAAADTGPGPRSRSDATGRTGADPGDETRT
jgi:hypothetical protein